MLPEQKLDALLTRHAEVRGRSCRGQHDPDTFVKLSREFAELGPVVESIKAYRAAQSRNLRKSMRCSTIPRPSRRCGHWPRAEKAALQERRDQLAQASPPCAGPERRDG